MTKKFIMLMGTDYSSRRKYAWELSQRKQNVIIVDHDVLNASVHGYLKMGKQPNITDRAKHKIVKALKRGSTVVYNYHNLKKEERIEVLNFIKENCEDVDCSLVYIKKKRNLDYLSILLRGYNGEKNIDLPSPDEEWDLVLYK